MSVVAGGHACGRGGVGLYAFVISHEDLVEFGNDHPGDAGLNGLRWSVGEVERVVIGAMDSLGPRWSCPGPA